MRLLANKALFFAAFSHVALADWYLWAVETNLGTSPDFPSTELLDQFYIWDHQISRDDLDVVMLGSSEDLSHDGDIGVRCIDCGTGVGPSDPSTVEIRTEKGHWTYYADRDGDLVDQGTSQSAGKCVPHHDFNVDCPSAGAPVGSIKGSTLLFCTTDSVPL
ncbi:hypothetical protein FSARC_6272 [Fusarium sarcochroum]|uniref:Uncharacterized protein n=1 Tax=Fusarium sarcochroum TaxID=1208366 RepID=A0A8H4TXS8_9HYPO|nr:hypothetical protein FSARC_6272 [Fusarium sarcochroum]